MRLFFAFSIVVALVSTASMQRTAGAAIPLEPAGAILDAFRSHSVVALSEGEHGNEQGYALRLALIRDPRFSAMVSDIVVECGNSRFQDRIDRFVNGGEASAADLRQVWTEGIEPGVACDRPIYEDFVREVRTRNASLPAQRRMHVLIGEPPVDWSAVQRPEDLVPWLESRDARFPAEVIRKEVLAKGHRALVVYGSGHLLRRNIGRNYEPENTIVSVLERGAPPVSVFSIWTTEQGVDVTKLQPSIAPWRAPSLALLKDTVLGAADFTFFYPYGGARVSVHDGVRTPVPREQWRSLRMDEQFDAILHLGALTLSPIPKTLCSDPDYMKVRLGRLTMFRMQDRIDSLNKYCAQP
jgi:hypothetical protein